MIVTIHQPTFFPYSGVLDKMRRSDVFVVMAQAQYTKGKYFNRFQLDNRWYTMSVNQKLEPLVAKRFTQPSEDWATIKRKLSDYLDVLEKFDDCIHESLSLTNYLILGRIRDLLGYKTTLVLDEPTELAGTERLVDLCARHGATMYLSGPSGTDYLEPEKFAERGIMVSVQQQVQPRAAVQILSEALQEQAA